MKKILYIMLITFVSIKATEFSIYEANYPNVKDYNVNIDEASLVIRPAGNYVEFNLYMTVSYDFESWFFKNYNELEFLWEFNLPSDAIIHEFWYWEGDSIIAAQVLDKWTAELLFSDVSTPLRNPGLLTQANANSDGQVAHQLKLFPIKRNEKRRFKIQYLVPGRPTVENIRVWLPMTQLVSAKTPGIDKLKIYYKYDKQPYEPKIIGTEVLASKNNVDLAAWEITIPIEYDQFVELELPSPIKNNAYFSTYKKNNENFYHLAVYPPEAPKIVSPRNILFLIDFNRFNTADNDGDFLLSYLKESVLKALNSDDSINVIVAYDDIIIGSDKWIGCTEGGIDDLFNKVMKRSFPSYNNLLPLISKAQRFINNQKGNAEVLVITNTNTINLNDADKNNLAVDIINKFKSGTKLHFIDFDNKSYLRYSYDGYYETQMQSFYGKMAYPTAGNLFFLRYNTLKSIINSFLYEEISHFENIEVQMRFQDGYAHSKHFIAVHEGYYPMRTPILQIGKYSGQLPVELTVFGKYRMTNVKYNLTITEADLVPGNEAIATSWYGGHIQSLLKLPYNPLTISDIIDLSIEQKILTPYSGFLVFNLDENNGYCEDCNDEIPDVTAVDSLESEITMDVSVFPNPFNPTTTISYSLPHSGKVTIRIYNVLGEMVNELVDEEIQKGNHSITFNGSQLASGMYILTLQFNSDNKNYFASKKLMLIK
ncbi:MAG: T9SS type A sorting domain-containing protein [Bacteroidetes bacterium]|nr:T9SS type A sorting domain-containing protein [Bacteroidota bacterium]